MSENISLQERIINDFKESIITKNSHLKNIMSVILGELERQPKKKLNDDETIKVIKSLIKSEIELLEGSGLQVSEYLKILKQYIPEQVNEKVIIKWINENIDFSQYKNKLQAIKPVVQQFGNSTSGSVIKRLILQS